MTLKTVAYTLAASILLLVILPGQAKTIELDFQVPNSSSVNCEGGSNGISCLKIESNGLAASRRTASLATNFRALVGRREKTSLTDTQQETMCLSGSGSNAATGNIGGFCIASDLNISTANFASFAVANETPVTGLQFLQVTLRDGSVLVGSSELKNNETPMKTVCTSAGGSNAAAGNLGGFCLAADLTGDNLAAFSVANGLPVAGLQFLQLTFATTHSLAESANGNINSATTCISKNGSTATPGNAGGFCLASDLSTSTAGVANFSVANSLPVKEIHFLQVSFGNNGTSNNRHPDTDTPTSVECISPKGSTATTGSAGGSCLTSDLSTLTKGSANFSLANTLSISNMQSLQAVFGNENPANKSQSIPEANNKCVTAKGSGATQADNKGFCLSSDRSASTINFSNFSMANALPVSALRFIQIPNQPHGSGYLPHADRPVGVVIFDSKSVAIPALEGLSGRKYRYFRIPQKKSSIKIQPGLNQSGRLPPMFLQGH